VDDEYEDVTGDFVCLLNELKPDARRRAGRRATDGVFRIGDCLLVALPKLPFDGSVANDPIYSVAFLFFLSFSAKSIAKATAFCLKPVDLCQIAFTHLLRVNFLILFSFFPFSPVSSPVPNQLHPSSMRS